MIRLDVVIPALDAAATLGATLERLATADAVRVAPLVVDGGSTDATRRVASAAGVPVIEAPRGRGDQLAAGARHGDAEWLLFLHADSLPGPGWDRLIAAFAEETGERERAGAFSLRFDDDARAARRVEALAGWRSRLLGLPYGDQGLVISRAFYRRLGGFGPLPIMEDVEFVRRIGRRRLAVLDGHVVTSAARYRRRGYAPRTARNLLCLALYALGTSPRLLLRLYG